MQVKMMSNENHVFQQEEAREVEGEDKLKNLVENYWK